MVKEDKQEIQTRSLDATRRSGKQEYVTFANFSLRILTTVHLGSNALVLVEPDMIQN